MTDKLLSIIVPVYNGENHIQTAIESLMAQDYRPIEIVLINDGSIDKTADIADSLRERYRCIKVIHQPNGGPGSARNAGLKIATGDYITFFDADDQIEPQTYWAAIALMAAEDADVVQFPTHYLFNSPKSFVHAPKTKQSSIKKDLYKLFMQETISSSVWDKIYKSTLLKNHAFHQNKLYEDMIFNSELIRGIDKICFSSTGSYLYTYRESSITNTKPSYKRTHDYVWARMAVYENSLKYPNLFLYRSRYLSNTFKHSEVLQYFRLTDMEKQEICKIIDRQKCSLTSSIINVILFKIGNSRFRILLLLRWKGTKAVFCHLGHKR